MGAIPSRESISLFSYFRGSYEVGMVPLTKYYFGSDAAVEAMDSAAGQHASASASPPATAARDLLRHQLRQQLLLMRRDPAVLYANAREVNNILESLLHCDSDKEDSLSERKGKLPAMSSSTRVPNEADANGSQNHSGSPVSAFEHAHHVPDSAASVTTPMVSATEASGSDLKVLGNDINIGSRDELLQRKYWSVMPDSNFSEQDLDHFLELVEETLFATNEELLAEDPIGDLNISGGAETTASPFATAATFKRPFLPVPCALCLAYPDGKERDGAFSLDGRVVNIIGYFGLMTAPMQDAFKVVKRIRTSTEAKQNEQRNREAEKNKEAMPILYLNTAILTSAGDRTLERVLVLAAVMLRQQFHTIGRRHLLQAKLDHLLRRQQQEPSMSDADLQMIYYLHSILALPHTTNTVLGARAISSDGVPLPYFDPLLEVPLPSIPRGIYKPTHYINAASNEPPRRLSSLNSFGRASLNGSTADNSFVASAAATATGCGNSASHLHSLPHDASSTFSSGQRVLLYPQGALMVNGVAATPSAIMVPDSLTGSAANAPLLMPGSMVNTQGGPSGSFPGSLQAQHPQQQQQQLMASTFPSSLPLDQAEEDAITMAFCRRLERSVVLIETASNNYSALKSLTENFAFLHCQIMLDASLTKMELIDLPGLAETPSFKPLLSAMTPVSTLRADTVESGHDGAHKAACTTAMDSAANSSSLLEDRDNELLSAPKSLARCTLSPSSAVVIQLDPSLMRQATMWASSFFHCPTRLPSGSWIKYKLKDECDQLRHVLQNKDMLIAHWRKTDTNRASQYLGVHTGRLLEHVRALQAETEEARALPADYWSHRPLFVNQDGRKYALFQSRYGTMLIGVRAFSSGSNPTTSLTPGERTTALSEGGRGGQGGPAMAPHPNHSNFIQHRPIITSQSHNGSMDNSGISNTNGNNPTLRGGGPCIQGPIVTPPFFMAGRGTLLPYTAAPHDPAYANCMGSHYSASPPFMAQQGGCNNSGGSRQNMSLAYMSSPSLNELLPGMMCRGPPPPPPPHQHPQESLGNHNTSNSSANNNNTAGSGGSSTGVPVMMAGIPQHFDPNRVIMSASVNDNNLNHYNGSSASLCGVEGTNVLHLIPQSHIFGMNHAPSLLGAAPNGPVASNKSSADATAQSSKPQVSSGAPLWQSTAASPLPTKTVTPLMMNSSALNSRATTISNPLMQSQPRVADPRGSPLHVTGVLPTQSTPFLYPTPTATKPGTTNSNNARDIANSNTTLPQDASLWTAYASRPHANSYSGLHDPPHHTSSAANGDCSSSTHVTTATAPLFSAHSIWELGHTSQQESCGVGVESVSTVPRSQLALQNAGVAGDSLTQLGRITPQPFLEQKMKVNASAPLLTREVDMTHEEKADARNVSKSSLPWTLKSTVDWTSTDDADRTTAQYLLRGTELLDVDDDNSERKAQQRSTVVRLDAAAPSHFSTEKIGISHALAGTQDDAKHAAVTKSRINEPHHEKAANELPERNATTNTYVPIDPRIPTPSQSHPTSTAYPMHAMEVPHVNPSHTRPSPLLQQQQQPQQVAPHPPYSVSTHPPATLQSNQLLYYTLANGVPMLVQAPTTPGGVAMMFPLSGTVTQGDSAVQSYAAFTSPQQPQPHQQQRGQAPSTAAFPFTAQRENAQAMPQSTLFVPTNAKPPYRSNVHNRPPSESSLAPHVSGATY